MRPLSFGKDCIRLCQRSSITAFCVILKKYYTAKPICIHVTMADVKYLSPRESGEIISKFAEDVSIRAEGVNSFAKKIFGHLTDRTISLDMFSQHELHPDPASPTAVDWIFLVDTLNYCFWSPDNAHWTVTYKGKPYTGYFALCAALCRAKDEGKPITDPSYYCAFDAKDVAHLLRGDEGSAQLSLLEERSQCLQDVGAVLVKSYEGSFVNCIKKTGSSAQCLLELIVREFPCFRDRSFYKGNYVSFYKRAQILVGDIWACYKGQGLGYFEDIDTITMFADYRVPQVLVYLGVLEYSSNLMKKLKEGGGVLARDSKEENEIRGCSIHAVELVCHKVKELLEQRGKTSQYQVNSILIDHFLWEFRRNNAQLVKDIPFHKVRTIYY